MTTLARNIAIYFATYTGLAFVAFWLGLMVTLFLQVAWKLILVAFFLAVAFATFDYVQAGNKISDLFTDWHLPVRS